MAKNRFTSFDLRMAFASGVDFGKIHSNIELINTSKFRDKGFDDFLSWLTSIRGKEKSSGLVPEDNIVKSKEFFYFIN